MPLAPASTRHIGLLLFDDVEELDAVGPWEVLSYWTLHHPEDGWSISCVSRDGAPVVAAKGLTLSAHHSMSGMPPLDVLIHPGGQGTRPLMRNPQHLAWVRVQAATVPLMTSVCTGALVYAAAGLLAGRPATTHWESLDLLHELDPSIDVNPDRPLRRRRQRHHQRRRQRRHRHGPAPGRPARRRRPGPRSPPRHPVRPPTSDLTRERTS